MRNGTFINRILGVVLVLAMTGAMLPVAILGNPSQIKASQEEMSLLSTVKTGAEPNSTRLGSQRKLVATSGGNLHVAYHRKDDSGILQIYHAESLDQGATWTEEQVTFASRDQNLPALAVDSMDNLHLVWEDGRHGQSGIMPNTYYKKKTTTWQPAELVASYATAPSIAIDSNDNVHVAYGVYVYTPGYYGGGNGIRWRMRTNAGWQSEVSISSDKYWSRYPAIAVDSNNTVHIAWSHAPTAKYDIHYRNRSAAGWGSEVEISRDSQCGDYPSIVIDSNSYVHVVWHHLEGRSSPYADDGYFSIRYRKYTDSWQPIEILEEPTAYHQYDPVVTIDNHDHIHVIWSGQHAGSPTYQQLRYRVYTTAWQSVENLTSSGSVDQRNPSLMWSFYPENSGTKTNQLEEGYAFVWMDGTTIRYCKNCCDRPPDGAPIARHSDINGQPKLILPNTQYTVTAKYFDPDGREDLKHCYLQLRHPSKDLTIMWYQADGHAAPWAGEEGENYLTIVNVDADPITEGGLAGYELAWTFTIKNTWPEVENAIDFGVYAWDDADLKSGWDYDDTKASFRLSLGLMDSFVDLGNLEDEAWHNLVGWGPMSEPPQNPYASPSGDRTKRYQTLRGDCSIDLWVEQTGVDYILITEVEDGNCTDSFEIYVNGQGPIYSYTGKHLDHAVVVHQVLVSKDHITDHLVTVTFRNTSIDDCGLAAVYNVGLTAATVTLPSLVNLQDLALSGMVLDVLPSEGEISQCEFSKDSYVAGEEICFDISVENTGLNRASYCLYVYIVNHRDELVATNDIVFNKYGIDFKAESGLPDYRVYDEYMLYDFCKLLEPTEGHVFKATWTIPDFMVAGEYRLVARLYCGHDADWHGVVAPHNTFHVINEGATYDELPIWWHNMDTAYEELEKRIEAFDSTYQYSEFFPVFLATEFEGFNQDINLVLTMSLNKLKKEYGLVRVRTHFIDNTGWGAWLDLNSFETSVVTESSFWGSLRTLGIKSAMQLAVNFNTEMVILAGKQVAGWILKQATGIPSWPITVLGAAHSVATCYGGGHKATMPNSYSYLVYLPLDTEISVKARAYVNYTNAGSTVPFIWLPGVVEDTWTGVITAHDGEAQPGVINLYLTADEMDYDFIIMSSLQSPGELRVYDSHGEITGLVDDEVVSMIPKSKYDMEEKRVIIFGATGKYTYEIAGKDRGKYGLQITSLREGEAISFVANDIPTDSGAFHCYTVDWDALARGEQGVTVSVDSDGDGVFEKSFTTGSELTGDQFILHTQTFIDFDPNVLNLRARGGVVTVYIELPEGFDVGQIDVSSIRLNGTVPALGWPIAIGDYNGNGIPDLMVKFDRRAVQAVVDIGQSVEITITGEVGGIPFMGTDTIRVIGP